MAETATRSRLKSATPKLDGLYKKVKACLIEPDEDQLADKKLGAWGPEDAFRAVCPITTNVEVMVEELKILRDTSGFGLQFISGRGAFGGHAAVERYMLRRLSYDGQVTFALRARSAP